MKMKIIAIAMSLALVLILGTLSTLHTQFASARRASKAPIAVDIWCATQIAIYLSVVV